MGCSDSGGPQNLDRIDTQRWDHVASPKHFFCNILSQVKAPYVIWGYCQCQQCQFKYKTVTKESFRLVSVWEGHLTGEAPERQKPYNRFHDKPLLWIWVRSLNMSITPHVEIILGSSVCCLLQTYIYLSGKSSQAVYIWSIFECAHSITLSILCSWEVFGQYANGVSEGWEALINRPTQPAREGFLHCICWQSSLLIFIVIRISLVDNIC